MVNSCCAVGCQNRAGGRKVTFHLIPSDKHRRQLWVHAINRIDAVTKKRWVPSRYDVICSEHFREEDFYLSKHRHLKLLHKTAVPSVFSWKHENQSRSASHRMCTSSLEFVKEQPPPADVGACVEVVTSDHSYACQPDTLKRKYHDTLQMLEEMQTELHNTKRREKRAKVCIDKILHELAEQKKLSDDNLQLLEAYKDIPVELFKTPAHEYSEDQKQFAATLHLYSSKAYEFLREKLHLPHPATIRRFLFPG